MNMYAVEVNFIHPDSEGYGIKFANKKMGYFSTYEKAEQYFNNAGSKEAQRIVDDTIFENENVRLTIVSYKLDECSNNIVGAQGTIEKELQFYVSELQQTINQLEDEGKYDSKEYKETLKQLYELHGESFEDEA